MRTVRTLALPTGSRPDQRMTRRPIKLAILLAAAALAVAVALSLAPGAGAPSSPLPADPRGVDPLEPNPLVGLPWYVDTVAAPAWRSYRTLKAQGNDRDAELMLKIARNPQFKWWGRWAGETNPAKALSWWLGRMEKQQPGAVPQLVVARHEGKKCSPTYLGGGARGDARYRAWIRNFARVVGNRRVVIAFEPDSIGTVDCLARHRRTARYAMLRYGVDVLSRLPNATIYIEGGASDWEHPRVVARKLRRVGIEKVRGFMVNATHKDWTKNSVQHCLDVSRLLGGKHCIVNTSHNGNGPLHYRKWIDRSRRLWRRITVWCNPPNEALGPAPTSTDVTRPDVVDGYFWIERPGFSNGFCNGGPKTGAWWKERALLLARRARWN
jgi:endoglucanase